MEVRLGDRDLASDVDDANVQMRKIEEDHVFFHPSYSFAESYYDIALVRLDPPVDLEYPVRTICLPTEASSNQDEYADDLVRLSGQLEFIRLPILLILLFHLFGRLGNLRKRKW